MPFINSTKFDEIIIDNKKYFQVLIIGDNIKERAYKRLKELYGTSHQIGDWEINQLFKNNPEIIIIGTGQDGMLEVRDDLIEMAKDKKIEIITMITSEAVKIYNEKINEGKRVNALMHTTC